MKKLLTTLIILMFVSQAFAATKHWNATEDRNFTNWNNWSATSVFTSTNDGAISKSGTEAPIMYSSSTALTTNRNLFLGASALGELDMQGSSITINRIEIGGDYWTSLGADGYLTMSGGTFTTSASTEIGQGNTGSLAISGGTYTIGSWLTIGDLGDKSGLGGTGILTMTGGELTADRVYVGQDSLSTGTVNLSNNADFSVDTYIYVGDADGSSGTITIRDFATLEANNISIRENGTVNFILNAGSSDSMMSFTSLTASDNFLIGTIDVSFDGTIVPGTYGLMDFAADMTGTDISALLSTSSAAQGWNLNLESSSNGSVLQAVYVPEPATLILLSIGGIALRKRQS